MTTLYDIQTIANREQMNLSLALAQAYRGVRTSP